MSGPQGEPVGEGLAAHPAHHEVPGARLAPVVVHGDQTGMADAGDPSRRGLEVAHEAGGVGELAGHDPDDELAVDAGEVRGVDGAVAATAEAFAEVVAADPSGVDGSFEQRRVVVEDLTLELDHRRRRVQPDLVAEQGTQVARRPQRFRLAAGPVAGDDQLAPEDLSQGLFDDECLQRGDDLLRPATCELRFDEALVGDEASSSRR